MNLLEFISKGLYLTDDEAKRYIATIPRRYKKFFIKKRNSEEARLIAQPARQVKSIQRAVIKHIRNNIRVHGSAFAYEKNKNIKKNAISHKSNRYLLKMDFKNFFMSIRPNDFLRVLKQQGIALDAIDIFVIENLFFWKQQRNSPLRLSVGAPSSPFISNAVMYFFDELMNDMCKELDIVYTRYADDMTFSTNVVNVLSGMPKIVRQMLNQTGFKHIRINHEKTKFSSKKHNRHVTGVTITNDETLSIGRERKRLLRSKIDYYNKGMLTVKEILTLKGELGFAKFIEPEFMNRMIAKYGIDTIVSIQKFKD